MTNKKTFEINSLIELNQVAREILDTFPLERIFLLNGDLGAGKTALCKEMIYILTNQENVTSPTFTIVNSYEGLGNKVYHYDLYRLKNDEEIYELGMEEYINTGYSFIEWPKKACNLLTKLNKVNIEIELRQKCRIVTTSLIK